ncbi:hypothetical protein Syun_031670 [Stephania yunnanensis]|uniref:Uncharacterized protein n=1 Tax=Stephania yunnanensis TaxID=152371 RepID=A0AAP0DV77_9MAGN
MRIWKTNRNNGGQEVMIPAGKEGQGWRILGKTLFQIIRGGSAWKEKGLTMSLYLVLRLHASRGMSSVTSRHLQMVTAWLRVVISTPFPINPCPRNASDKKEDHSGELMKRFELGKVPDDEIRRLIRVQLDKRIRWGDSRSFEQQIADVLMELWLKNIDDNAEAIGNGMAVRSPAVVAAVSAVVVAAAVKRGLEVAKVGTISVIVRSADLWIKASSFNLFLISHFLTSTLLLPTSTTRNLTSFAPTPPPMATPTSAMPRQDSIIDTFTNHCYNALFLLKLTNKLLLLIGFNSDKTCHPHHIYHIKAFYSSDYSNLMQMRESILIIKVLAAIGRRGSAAGNVRRGGDTGVESTEEECGEEEV